MAVLERDYRIDGIKWLLIVLVTFGHVIEPALSNPIANKLYSNLHFSYAIIRLYQWLLCKC